MSHCVHDYVEVPAPAFSSAFHSKFIMLKCRNCGELYALHKGQIRKWLREGKIELSSLSTRNQRKYKNFMQRKKKITVESWLAFK